MARNGLAAILLVTLLTACGGLSAPMPSAPASARPASSLTAASGQPLQPVKIAWCAISAGFAQLFVARDAGLFPKYGLQLSTAQMQGSEPCLSAQLAGEIDFIYSAASGSIPGLATGMDGQFIAAPLLGLPYVLVTRKGINSLQDLKGKSLGISRPGDLDERLTKAMLKHENIPVESVTLRPAGGQTERYKALLGGFVDGVTVTPPLEVQARKDGLNVAYKLNNVPIPFIYTALQTSTRMIKERPDAVQKTVAVMAEAVYYMETHKAEAEQSIGKQLQISDQEALESAWQAYSQDIINRGMRVPLDAIQADIDFARSNGTEIRRTAESMVENRFVEELHKSGFMERLWGRPIS